MDRHHFALSNDDRDFSDNSGYWQAFFDSALDAMLIADDDGLYVNANPAACELFGLPLAELLGCNISDFSEPGFDFSPAWRSFLDQGEMKGEFRLFRRDGVVRDLELAVAANFLPHRHLSVLRDVTKRKQGEAVLRDNEELNCINCSLIQEIRERQEIEDALGKSQTFLFQIINTIPDPVFVKNEDHQWIALNDACCAFIGIGRTELIGKTDYDFFPKEEADIFWEQDKIVLKTGLDHENEESLTSQGKTRTILTKKSLLRDISGNKILVGVSRDITERKLAEAALRDSENRFRSMFEQGAIGIVMSSLDGFFLQVNQNFCELVGYSQAELLNLSYVDITYRDDQPEQLVQWHSLLAGEIANYSQEKCYVRKDGSLVWVKVTISLMRDPIGTPQYAVGLIQDINNSKKSEEFLHHSEEQFRALVENSPDIIARYDKELRFLYVNPAMGQATGIVPEMFIGKRHQDLKLSAAKCTLWNEAIQAVFLTGQEQVFEFDFVTPNGLRFYQSRLVPEFNREKKIASVLSVSRDITERQQAEAELQEAKQVADLANRTKSDFLTNISHELRTPLNGILGYAQILKQDENLLGRQQNSLNIIYQCGIHLLTLIDDILDLSKIESQQTELYFTEFNFENFLNTLVELFQMRAQQKGILFSYESLYPLPKVIVADEKRLRQVLINLLSNAVKFTDLGGVTFKVCLAENNSEKLSKDSFNVKIRFQVEDTGIGINSSHFEEIFLPFCQVGDRSRFIEGTGLGLAISQKLVKFMGTSIQVRSTLGKGSIFWFNLELPQALEDHPVSTGKSAQMAVECLQKENLCSTSLEPNLLSIPIATPPVSELSALSQLVQMGDIAGIINYVERLEMLDTKLLQFTTQTRQLAKGFKLKQLLEFIEQCLSR